MALFSLTSALAMRPDRVGLEVGPGFWLNGGPAGDGQRGKPTGTRKYLGCLLYLVPPSHIFSPRELMSYH